MSSFHPWKLFAGLDHPKFLLGFYAPPCAPKIHETVSSHKKHDAQPAVHDVNEDIVNEGIAPLLLLAKAL